MSNKVKGNNAPKVEAVAEIETAAIAPAESSPMQDEQILTDALGAIQEAILEESKQAPVLPNVKERIQRIYDLKQQVEQFEKLENHLEDVRRVNLASGMGAEYIEIQANGERYQIRNQNLCADVCALLERKLSAKLAEMERHITFDYPND